MCGRAMSSMSAPNIGPRVASVFAAGTRRLPIQQTASAAAALPSAIPQKAGYARDHFVTWSTSASAPSASASTDAASFGSVTIRASSARSVVCASRSTARSGGAVSTAAAHPARISAAHTNAPGQVIQSERMSTSPEASIPTR